MKNNGFFVLPAVKVFAAFVFMFFVFSCAGVPSSPEAGSEVPPVQEAAVEEDGGEETPPQDTALPQTEDIAEETATSTETGDEGVSLETGSLTDEVSEAAAVEDEPEIILPPEMLIEQMPGESDLRSAGLPIPEPELPGTVLPEIAEQPVPAEQEAAIPAVPLPEPSVREPAPAPVVPERLPEQTPPVARETPAPQVPPSPPAPVVPERPPEQTPPVARETPAPRVPPSPPAVKPVEPAVPAPRPVPPAASPLPELPARTLPETSEGQIVFSRVVRAVTGQIIEIPFRGKGWVYLGELGNRRGIRYDSTRLDLTGSPGASGVVEGQSVIFHAEAPGTYILKFYRQDFIQDYIINDYVQVIVGEASDLAGTVRPGFPVDRGRVIAEPRWPPAGETAATPAPASSVGRTGDVPQIPPATETQPVVPARPETAAIPQTQTPPAGATAVPQAEERPAVPVSPISPMETPPAAPVVPARPETAAVPQTQAPPAGATAVPQTEERPAVPVPPVETQPVTPLRPETAAVPAPSPVVPAETAAAPQTQTPPAVTPRPRPAVVDDGIVPVAPPQTAAPADPMPPGSSPADYVRRAKEEFDAGRIEQALTILDSMKQRYPLGTDEALWLYGQLLEANSPSRDIRLALEYYRRLVREYPQSTRAGTAQQRIAYLERYYLNMR